jgi:PAS domain-containing protein
MDTTVRGRVWARDLSLLRSRASKRRRGPQFDSADPGVAEEALALCDSMLQDMAARDLECRRLHTMLRAQTQAWDYLFAQLPVACIVTDRNGSIADANRMAGLLLNVSPKHLLGRSLVLFSTDRPAFSTVLQQSSVESAPMEASMILRPRERKRVAVRATVVPPLPGGSDVWLWFFATTAQGDATAAMALDKPASEEFAKVAGDVEPI